MSASAESVLRARIDTDALTANARAIRTHVGERTLMCVVKADAYGHGVENTVPALLRAGVRDLGVATLPEALALRIFLDERADSPHVRVLFWIHDYTTDLAPALQAGLEVGCSTAEAVDRALDAAARTGIPARVHLKVDTGLGRGGLSPAQLTRLLARLRELTSTESALLTIAGLMTHLANADVPADPATQEQTESFAAVLAQLRDFLAGVGGALGEPESLETHLANSPGALGTDDVGGTMVRVGLSTYGLSPFEHLTASQLGLRPAMSLVSRVLAVKDVPAGHGASYGLTYRAPEDTRFALIAGGYADGLPRAASGRAQVSIRGTRLPVVGRIAMDQMVVDAGRAAVEIGDEVVVMGDGVTGPSAEEWGEWAGTINYEIVTRVGPRVDRVTTEASRP